MAAPDRHIRLLYGAVRLRKCKEHAKAILSQSTFMHIDMATVNDTAIAPWLFNPTLIRRRNSPSATT